MYTTETYPYKPRLWLTVTGTVLFEVLTYLSFHNAMSDPRSRTILYIVELSTQSATYLNWAYFALFLILSIIMMAALLSSVFSECREIILSANTIRIPARPFSKVYVEVLYKDISSLHLSPLNHQRTLIISHCDGTLYISDMLLPSKMAFDEMHQLLIERAVSSSIPKFL